jgi:hypothetical protein
MWVVSRDFSRAEMMVALLESLKEMMKAGLNISKIKYFEIKFDIIYAYLLD